MFVNPVLFISTAAFGVWSVLRMVYVNVCPLNSVFIFLSIHIIFFVRTVYQLWLHSNICMHCRVYRTHQDFQSHGCSVHMICHDLWTVLLVGVGGAPACHA